MNDKGKTVKTLVRVKADFKTIKERRCASINIDLELADGVGEGNIHDLMRAVSFVKERVVCALAEEFLP